MTDGGCMAANGDECSMVVVEENNQRLSIQLNILLSDPMLFSFLFPIQSNAMASFLQRSNQTTRNRKRQECDGRIRATLSSQEGQVWN
jgi:hypothetical protein